MGSLYSFYMWSKTLHSQWELFSPQLCLPCPNEGCNGNLCHTRTNFSKNNNQFSIYRLDEQHDWAFIMKHQCNCCTAIFDGNDGCVLIIILNKSENNIWYTQDMPQGSGIYPKVVQIYLKKL